MAPWTAHDLYIRRWLTLVAMEMAVMVVITLKVWIGAYFIEITNLWWTKASCSRRCYWPNDGFLNSSSAIWSTATIICWTILGYHSRIACAMWTVWTMVLQNNILLCMALLAIEMVYNSIQHNITTKYTYISTISYTWVRPSRRPLRLHRHYHTWSLVHNVMLF